MRHLGMVTVVVAAILFPGRASPQQAPPVPPRPELDPGADTNSAAAYYARGVEWLAKHPRRAADAFHWATLLEPDHAEAFYGRWAAGLLSRPRLLVGRYEWNRSVLGSEEYRRLDSLLWRAFTVDPFFFRGLEEVLLTGYITEAVRRVDPRLMGADLQYAIAGYLRSDAGPYIRASVAYTYQNFPRALDQLSLVLRTAKEKAGLHWSRALVHHHLGQYDSAAAEIRAELEAARLRDTTEEVWFYQSKAVFELSLGRLLESQSNLDGAYDAYLRSAAEDLGFAPAHVHLAILALQRGDTATALSETNLALDIQADDPGLLVKGALLLITAGRALEAIPHLQRAREMNPHFATPWFLLARLNDVSGMPESAVQHYQAFLARTSQHDTRSEMVRERLAVLRGSP